MTPHDNTRWVNFAVEIDTGVVVDLSDGDGVTPVNGDEFVGEVVEGRRHEDSAVIQWRVRFDDPPEFADGRSVEAMWVSVRYVGDKLAFLQDPEFTDSLVAVVQDDVAAWRAFLWRSDREP